MDIGSKPRFAQVVINIPLDRIFTYQIPPHLVEKTAVGTRVLIPFRNRRLIGHVVEITDKTTVPNLKPIYNVLDNSPIISPSLLRLHKWIADYYLTSWGSVISSSLPSGIGSHKKSISIKKINFVHLCADNTKIQQFLQKHGQKAPKQAAILNALLKQGEISLPQILKMTQTTHSSIQGLVQKGLVMLEVKEVYRDPVRYQDESAKKKITPNPDQQKAVQQIKAALNKEEFVPFLLHGITGSGKTYVYLQAVAHVLHMNKTAMIMVPEISLTHQLLNLFYDSFGDQIAIFHSALGQGERIDEWRRILRGEAKVAIGARSAIFSPLNNLGLIILDEEHETSYKQDNSPRYHARETALMRAKMSGAVVVLGSATPSMESFHAAEKGVYTLLNLPRRATPHHLSKIKLVDMRKEYHQQKNQCIFSHTLTEAINQRLERKEQIILFLNRRGFSSFLLCCDCGHVPKCRNCSVSLTYHANENRLRCHYCSYVCVAPQTCPDCKKGMLQRIGFGTQKVEEEARKLFPSARIERMDQDTVTRKTSHQQILSRLGQGKIDLLIGTQMIAKGLDFPRVTLVGVVAADTILNLPDFRSAERTFQLITQVSGRAGRGEIPGEVIVQTFTPSHYSLQCASSMDYQGFYEREINYRKQLGYPPFGRMINIIIRGGEINTLKHAAQRLANFLISLKPDEITILGPAQAPIFKIRGQHRYQILLKSNDTLLLNTFIRKGMAEFYKGWPIKGIQVDINVDPINLM
ncbi:MAG: primosomal protein N' [Deltaproteobacteria bacterium]|nr:primosomal protein N' [Deltaproteobacteria bacterium]